MPQTSHITCASRVETMCQAYPHRDRCCSRCRDPLWDLRPVRLTARARAPLPWAPRANPRSPRRPMQALPSARMLRTNPGPSRRLVGARHPRGTRPSRAATPGGPGAPRQARDPIRIGLQRLDLLCLIRPLRRHLLPQTIQWACQPPAHPRDRPGLLHLGSSVPDVSPETAATVSTPPRTRLQTGVIQPTNYKVKFGLACSTGEPRNFHEALVDPKWKKAMEEEFQALQKSKTWHLVPSHQSNNLMDVNGCSR